MFVDNGHFGCGIDWVGHIRFIVFIDFLTNLTPLMRPSNLLLSSFTTFDNMAAFAIIMFTFEPPTEVQKQYLCRVIPHLHKSSQKRLIIITLPVFIFYIFTKSVYKYSSKHNNDT